MENRHQVTYDEISAALNTSIVLATSGGKGAFKRLSYNPYEKLFHVYANGKLLGQELYLVDAIETYNNFDETVC